jgi:hypothetical protein
VAITLASALCLGGFAYAQGTQTGILTGTVTDQSGLKLPGVSVTVTSPALQGVRSAVSEVNGDYVLKGLPPGTYKVTFELPSFATVERTVKVVLGGEARVDASLAVGTIEETIVVTAEASSVLTTPQVGANYKGDQIDKLPTGRTLAAIAELAPGLTSNTPNAGQVTISGSFAYDNVFLVNGVDVNDNLFGNPNNLFIEDAIEETQVLTSGISAEYGRFSGGVINTITKSGGNAFSGSIRTDFTNSAWRLETPFQKSKDQKNADKTNFDYQATLGGPIVKDRLWFFTAARMADRTTTETFQQTGVGYDRLDNNKRMEAKLTGSLNPNHRFQASYLYNTSEQTQPSMSISIDPATLYTRELPNSLFVGNYHGILRSNLFLEVQYSQKEFQFKDAGGKSPVIADSPIISLSDGLHYNAPYWDATDPENRDNRQITANLSYVLSTQRGGTHDLKVGFEHYKSTRTGGNSQSATDYVFDADYAVGSDGKPLFDSSGRMIPVFVPGETLIENWQAVRGAEVDTKTLSLFANDRWAVNRRLSLNLGVRYEQVRGQATGDITTVDTDTIVPRLAVSYDIKGDGKFHLDATYAHYAGKYSESQFANNTNVGNPTLLMGVYTGPAGQGRDFLAGFTPANYETFTGQFPTANIFVEKNLHSPAAREFTLAGGTKLGEKGTAKLIYSWRRMTGFVEDFIDTTTGKTNVTRNGIDFGTFDNTVYRNSETPVRDYQALQLQAQYRPADHWGLEGHYTYQLKDEGNFEGEATNQPGITSSIGDYPEIFSQARQYPLGRLNDFQRHKARIWTNYDFDIGRAGHVGIGLLWRYNSALSYSLAATRVPLSAIQIAIAQSMGYLSYPNDQTLFFGERGIGSFSGAHLLDAAINYDIPVFKSARPYVKLEARNIFNNDTLIQYNTTISRDRTGPADELGLATQYVKGVNFGKGTSNDHYPIPRELRFSLGFRF